MSKQLKGDWLGLSSAGQRPRYEAIVNLIFSECDKDAALLDIGCGSGVLNSYVNNARGATGSYCGVESSPEAVIAAQDSGVNVIHVGAEHFETTEKWDCIILSEMLYYCKDPIALLRKMTGFLAPRGVILITIYHRPDKPRFLRRILRIINESRPSTNRDCSRMVERFLLQAEWPMLARQDVNLPGTDTFWRMWLVRPPTLPNANSV